MSCQLRHDSIMIIMDSYLRRQLILSAKAIHKFDTQLPQSNDQTDWAWHCDRVADWGMSPSWSQWTRASVGNSSFQQTIGEGEDFKKAVTHLPKASCRTKKWQLLEQRIQKTLQLETRKSTWLQWHDQHSLEQIPWHQHSCCQEHFCQQNFHHEIL